MLSTCEHVNVNTRLTGWSASSSDPYINTRWEHWSNSEIFMGNHGTSSSSVGTQSVRDHKLKTCLRSAVNKLYYSRQWSDVSDRMKLLIIIVLCGGQWEVNTGNSFLLILLATLKVKASLTTSLSCDIMSELRCSYLPRLTTRVQTCWRRWCWRDLWGAAAAR